MAKAKAKPQPKKEAPKGVIGNFKAFLQQKLGGKDASKK
jgi:hypothetical protein